MEKKKYDGFHFLPDIEIEDGYVFQFFVLNDATGEETKEVLIGGTNVGELYNVLLLKQKEDGIEVSDVFQAIFADPEIYAEGLIGTDYYGTFLKNSEHTKKWWDLYVKTTIETVEKFNKTGDSNV